MNEAQQATTKLNYKVGDTLRSGSKIAFIYGHSPVWLVFQDEAGDVQWYTNKDALSPLELEVNRRFDELHAAIGVCLRKSRKKAVTHALAQAFHMALSEQDPIAAFKHFDPIDRTIRAEATALVRLHYVVSSAAAAIIACVLMAVVLIQLPESPVEVVLIGACAATVGAWTSVLQRTSHLIIAQFDPPEYISIQGVTRVIIGGIFGAILVVASKAGLLITVATTNLWATVTFAFLAGVSERFVPDLLGKLDGSQRDGTATAQKTPTED